MYNDIHTAFDVMKEFLIIGAELDGKYQIPMLPPCNFDYYPEDSIDFEESFSRKIKNHRKLNVNFYIDDTKFTRLWNNPDKYLNHLKCKTLKVPSSLFSRILSLLSNNLDWIIPRFVPAGAAPFESR